MKQRARATFAALGTLALAASTNLPAFADDPVPPRPTPAPAPLFSATTFKELDGKECFPAALTDAGYMSVTCDGIGYVYNNGAPVTLKTAAAGFTINAYHVQAGNAAGMLAGIGRCTANKEGAVRELCMIRWDAQGEPTVILPRNVGGEDVDGVTVSDMNAIGDIAYTELTKDNLLGYFNARIWWTDGEITKVNPSEKDAGILIASINNVRMAAGIQIINPPMDEDPAPTPEPTAEPTSSPEPPAPPRPTGAPTATSTEAPRPPARLALPARIDGITIPFAHLRQAVTSRATGNLNAFMTYRGDSKITLLRGHTGDVNYNRLLDGSDNGAYWVGSSDKPISDEESEHTPVRFLPYRHAEALKPVANAHRWEPRYVNDRGTILGDVYNAPGEEFRLTPVFIRQDQAPIVMTPQTVEGLSDTARFEVSQIDNNDRMLASVLDGDTSHLVLITRK